jgi:hypothetical protein
MQVTGEGESKSWLLLVMTEALDIIFSHYNGNDIG